MCSSQTHHVFHDEILSRPRSYQGRLHVNYLPQAPVTYGPGSNRYGTRGQKLKGNNGRKQRRDSTVTSADDKAGAHTALHDHFEMWLSRGGVLPDIFRAPITGVVGSGGNPISAISLPPARPPYPPPSLSLSLSRCEDGLYLFWR